MRKRNPKVITMMNPLLRVIDNDSHMISTFRRAVEAGDWDQLAEYLDQYAAPASQTSLPQCASSSRRFCEEKSPPKGKSDRAPQDSTSSFYAKSTPMCVTP